MKYELYKPLPMLPSFEESIERQVQANCFIISRLLRLMGKLDIKSSHVSQVDIYDVAARVTQRGVILYHY